MWPLLLCLVGCAEEVEETALDIRRDARNLCRAENEGQPLGMDTFVAELYETTLGEEEGSTPFDCGRCLNAQGFCMLRARQCRCGPSSGVDTDAMRAAFSGLRLEGAEPQIRYCIRILALERGQPAAGAEECDCALDWFAPAALRQSSRACALSPPAYPAKNPVPVYLTCRGDGEGSEASVFSGCVADAF